MELRVFDDVKLKIELPEFKENGIKKGQEGFITKIQKGVCEVCFLNEKNYGDYAFAMVSVDFLEFFDRDEKFMEELYEDIESLDRDKKSFLPFPFKEFDKVELIANKERYTKKGVSVGTFGCVNQSYAIKNKIEVIFFNVKGEDVELLVNINDIKLIE